MANNKRGFLKALGFICLGIFMATFIFTLATHQGFKGFIKSSYGKYKKTKTPSKLFVTENKEWFYDYADVGTSDDYFPIVNLRSGHKIIRKSGDTLLVGWQYELINTAEKNYLVEITYQILDNDGFLVAESNKSKWIKGKSFDVISNTLNVSCEDKDRLTENSWSIGLTPSYDDKDIKDKGLNRLDKACNILKENEPYLKLWIKQYAEYCLCTEERFNEMKSENSKWYRIANALGVTPDLELFELRKSFHTYFPFEPIKEIWESKEYKSLTKGQSDKISHWLYLEGEFNQYYDFFKGGVI